MTKTIEEAANEYASAIEPDRLGRGDLESAFEAGADFVRESQWIPVEKELPTDGVKVILIYNGIFVFVLNNPSGKGWKEEFGKRDDVTHWALMPQPPKK